MYPESEQSKVSLSPVAGRFATYRYLNPYASIELQRANLPHWRQEGVTYFVTFRLADSIPQTKLRMWRAARDRWLARHPDPRSTEDRVDFFNRFSTRLEAWLDSSYGACLLRSSACASIVADALRFFDGKRYALGAFVVAANHVHGLVTPHAGQALEGLLHRWKSYMAKEINRCLGRTGTVWQKESYDHILRDPSAAWRIERYMAEHPS